MQRCVGARSSSRYAMGLIGSKILARFFNKETRILMLGLDAAGKTTVCSHCSLLLLLLL